MNKRKITAILFALAAAFFYAINIPLSKLLLENVGPTFMASFLYFGAGIGIGIVYFVRKKGITSEQHLTRQDLPYTIGMILLDIAAPIFLMAGLTSATSSNASLLNNFEIVATTIIALLIFKEAVSWRLWTAIVLITLSSMILSFEDMSSLQFSYGSIFVIAAAVCWGFENNCTRKISSKNTYEIVMIKGIFSGLGSFIIATVLRENFPSFYYIAAVLILGFVAYGLSIFLYIKAQSELGASRTSAYYSISPFVGSLLSFIILKEALNANYLIALIIMTIGSALAVADTLIISHSHIHTHTFVHRHNGYTHTHTIEHTHPHNHYLKGEMHNHYHILN